MKNVLTDRMLDFIADSLCSYFAVANAARRLDEAGFTRLLESQPWQLVPGGRYYTTRGGSSLIAFTLPKTGLPGFIITASHTDSPAFKLKQNPHLPGKAYVRLNTEKYGGMLFASWFDRPLEIAGRVLVRTPDGGIAQRLVELRDCPVIIPNVAIHMNRAANDGVKLLANIDLPPIFAPGGAETSVLALAAEAAGVTEADVLGHDLLLCNRQPGAYLGAGAPWVGSPRLDDLECAFACLEGFLTAPESASAQVCCLFDNEEVGSETPQGAASTLLRDVLRRVCEGLGMGEADYCRAVAASFLLSADNAHALHPNHPEYADGENCPVMNGGVVVKFNAAQHYTTDGGSAALLESVCRDECIPTQVYANRSDLAGGSTLGNIALTQVSLHSADVGLAQLAMHSAFETAGADDPAHLTNLAKALYGRTLRQSGDGSWYFGR